MPPFHIADGISIVLQSISGDTYEVLYDTNHSGDLLEVTIEISKFGGVQRFSFNMPRDKHIILSSNTRVFFYVNQYLWFNGFIKDVPLDDQNEPIKVVEGVGFIDKLKDKVINETYAAQSLSAIIADIASTYLGAELDVYYDAGKITVPTITGIDVEFKDKTLYEVFERLLAIANYDYDTTKYILYIDTENELVITSMSSSLLKHLFEGYQYQTPEVSRDASEIINKILAYRTKTADPDVVEYVSTVQDTTSQGKYGLFESKITFPDYIDSTTIGKICDYIIARYKNPQLMIGIMSLQVTAALTFGLYRLSNRREKYWKTVCEMDSIATEDGWDFSNMSVTTVELSTTRVLTGRRSIKFTTADGSRGEYAEFTLPEKVPFPIEVNIFVYFVSVTASIVFRLYDSNNNYEDIMFNIYTEALYVDTVGGTVILQVDTISGVENLNVDFLATASFDTWSRLNRIITTIVDLSKIRIIFDTNTAVVFYVDLAEAFADMYNTSDLELENIIYHLSSLGTLADCQFGNKQKNIIDEILSGDEESLVALKVISKQ